jgi:alpha-L-fucosidase
MVDVPIRNHEWFWRPNDDHKVYTSEALVDMYYNSVGRNCNLLIGTTPDSSGRIPEVDCLSGAAFGKEIHRRFGRPLAETRGNGTVVHLRLKQPARIDHVVLMEDIAQGERIRQYTMEGLAGPNRWTKLGDGESVGHKRIHRFDPIEVAALRVTAGKATGEPLIRSLAAYAPQP